MTKKPDLDVMIGQLFICGFDGLSLPNGLEKHLENGTCGGVILFTRNLLVPTQITSLTQNVFDRSNLYSPWISIDQEGGRVQRIRHPFSELPPAAVLGELHSEAWATRYGKIIGEEMAAAGFNLVFAPVLDVNTNPDNPVIADRSISNDPNKVAHLAMKFAEGLISEGIMPCGKHFPGHGDTTLDSHFDLPSISHSIDRLESIELFPFKVAVDQKIPSIMTAHVLFEALDPLWPATLSKTVLYDILRKKWGYEGLIISDDLEMKAVADRYPIDSIVVQGIKSGVDLFLICQQWDMLEEATSALKKAVSEGEISKKRIEESFERNLLYKQRFATQRSNKTKDIHLFLQKGEVRKQHTKWLQDAWKELPKP